jgi:hypothetical protein
MPGIPPAEAILLARWARRWRNTRCRHITVREPIMTELELFEAALERSPTDRAACLDEACAGNQPLRQRLEALLARHEKAASFLEAPAVF